MFERKGMPRDASDRHFGLMVRDEPQLAEVSEKLTTKYGIELIAGFRCDFRGPVGLPHPGRRSSRRISGLAAPVS
jgi:hypothetical protein